VLNRNVPRTAWAQRGPAAWFVGGAFALAAVGALIAAIRLWAHPFAPSSLGSLDGLTSLLVLVTAILISAALLVSVVAVVVRSLGLRVRSGCS
jgi:hypothetical protein